MKVLSLHRYADGNIGDCASNPLPYFQWPASWEISRVDIETISRDVNLFNETSRRHVDLLVVGGGGLLHPVLDEVIIRLKEALRSQNSFLVSVIWGIGSNYHDLCRPHWHHWIAGFDMVGLRDSTCPWEYVPCCSCMNSAFDIMKPDEVEPFVVFEHWQRPLGLPYPTLSNRGIPIEDMRRVVEHLASGSIVITNSYHGAYWAQLLGKGVIVIDPNSSRFHSGLPIYPVMARKENYLDRAGEALIRRQRHHLIDSCRSKNRQFAAQLQEKMQFDPTVISYYPHDEH